MASVALSNIPGAGRELEDYVAGLFQAAGYFVEKNIRQREFTDVLELDAVATSYDEPVPRAVLAEAKGGRWGFPDLFKVAGWMRYLGIERGGFFVKESAASPRDVARIHAMIARLGVSLVDLGDFSDAGARLGESGFRAANDPLSIDLWRYSFWVERTLLEKLRQARRSNPQLAGPQAVLAYHDLINDHAFFIPDVAERLGRLYDAYKDHPKLSAAVASELAGLPFTRAAHAPKSRVLVEAMYEGKHAALQASFYVEHRARLSILKAAIDLCCLGAAGRLTPGGRPFEALPATFREGLKKLRREPEFRRYALVWQVFLWGFGGFWLAHREDEELGWLSEQTSVPRSEIKRALRAFDELFPLGEGSWLVPLRNTRIIAAKMVPMAFRGIGAVQRLRRYGVKNYDALGGGPFTRRDLVRWHNSAVALLR